MTIRQRAKAIVSEIVVDLTSRRGLQQEFEMIDDETKDEIIETWENIVIENLI